MVLIMTKTPFGRRLSVVIAAGVALCAAPSFATTYLVSGSGLWVNDLEDVPTTGMSGTAVTEYSADNTKMTFSFEIDQTFTYVTMIGSDTVPTTAPATDLSDFTYTLGGNVVTTSLSPTLPPNCSGAGVLCDVEFFTTSDQQGGALGLDFGDYTVEFIGADFGSTGTLQSGNFDNMTINIDYTEDGNGHVIDEGTAKIDVTSVPEPSTWALMVIGVGGLGAALRTRARKLYAA
jgi:hypothetical protein